MQRTSNHFILNVQYCKSCDTHNWCTHHDEQKYINTYQKLKHHLQKLFGKDIYVQGNVIPSQLVPIKPAQNKYFNSKTNKYVTFPAIGAFQISFGNQILFSKKKTNNWPNFTEVADKVYFKLNGKQRSPQQKQNSIANAQERIHSADVDVKTEKDNLSVKNQSFLDHNDKRSTFYKSKPNQQKNFTLTDHFRNYHNADYKNPIDVKRNSDDFFTTNPTDNQNQLSEVSSFRNNNSSERDFLEFKRNFESGLSEHGVKLSELIKKKGYMKEDLGKKEMIIRLDSIQEESLLVDENASFNYGQNVNLTNTHSTFKSKSKDSHQKLMKRFNDDFQQLEAKFKKFQQKVQTIRQENKKFDHHNKDSSMCKINQKLMKEINQYKKKQKKLRNSQMNQLDLEDLEGEQGMMDNPIVFARRKLKNIEDYINGTEEEKNQKLKKIYGEWKLLKKPYKGKSYVSPYKIEVKKRHTEDKIQPQFKNSNELNDYTSSSSSQETQQIHSKNTDLHSSNQKLPQMQNMKMKSPQNKQVLTQQKFYSTARDKFNEIGNRKLKKDKKLIPHSHSATLNQFHRASDGVKLNTFDHYQQAAQKSDQFLSVNSNEIQPRTFYSNQKSYNKGRKLKSIPKNGQKQNFLTNQTSSRGRQLSRSSSNINEERMINQVINSKKAKLNSQIGSGHSNASASKSKNFRSKKKQNISKSKSKDNSPFKQKVINLMEDQQCDINGSSSVQSNEENLVQDSHEHSQSLNNNFLEKDAKSKFSNQKPSEARKLKNYEKGIGENKQWKEKDEESVKVNKKRKNLKKEQTEQRSSGYLTSQKKYSQEQRGSQGQIVTSYHKLQKKSKNQVLKQLQKQKKFKKDKLNTEDNQVSEKYKKRSNQQKIMKIQNNSQDEDQIQQYPQGQSQKIQKETRNSKNRKQTYDKPIKGKQKAKKAHKQTSDEQDSNQSENQVAEFSENQAEPKGKNIGKRKLKLKQQNKKKNKKGIKKQTQHSKKIENQQQSESEKSENEETLGKNNRVKANKSKQKENLVRKKSKNQKSQNQDDRIKNQTSQSDEQELVSYGDSNNATEKDTLSRKNKELSNNKQDSNQNELKKKKISPKIKQEELDQAKEEQSRSCEQQQERIEPVKTEKKKSKTKKTERQTDKILIKSLKHKFNKTKLQQSQERENSDQSCDAEQNSQSQGQREEQSEKNQQNGQLMEEQQQLNTNQKKETSKTSKKGVKTSNKKGKQTKENKSKGKEIEKVKSKQKTLKNNTVTKNLSQDEQDHEEDQLGDSSNSVQSNNSQTSDDEDGQFQKTDQVIDNSNYSDNKKSKNPDQIVKNKKQHSKKEKKQTKVNQPLRKNDTDDQVCEQELSNQSLQEHSEQDKISQSHECIEVSNQASENQQLLNSSKSKQSKSKIKSIKESSLKSNKKKPTEPKRKNIRQKPQLNQSSNSQSHSNQQEQSNTISKKQSQSSSSKNNKKNLKQKLKLQNSEILSEQEKQQHTEQSQSQKDENKSQSSQQQHQKTKEKIHSKGLKAKKTNQKISQTQNENIKSSKTNSNKKNKDQTNNQSIQAVQEQISQGLQSKPKKNNNKSKGKSLLERQQQQHSQQQQQDQNSEKQHSASQSVLQPQNEGVKNSSQNVNKSKSNPSKSKRLNNQTKQIQQDSSTVNKSNERKLKEKKSKQKGQCHKKQKKGSNLQRTDQIDQGQNLNEDTQNQTNEKQTSELNQQSAQNLLDQSQKESQRQNEQGSASDQKQKPKLAKTNPIGHEIIKKSSKQKAKVQKSQESILSSQNQEPQEENEQQSETEKQLQAENQTQETPQNVNVNQLNQKKSANKSKKNSKAKIQLQKSNNNSIQTKEKEQQQPQQEVQQETEQEESQKQLYQGQQNEKRKKSNKTKEKTKANKKNKANSTITHYQQQFQQSHPIQPTQIQQRNLQQQQTNQVVQNNLSLKKSEEKLSQNYQEVKDSDPQKSQEKKQLQIRLNTARTSKTSRKNKILNVYHTSRDPHCEDQEKQEEDQDNQKVAQVQGQKTNNGHQDKVGTKCDPLISNKQRSMTKKHSIDTGTQVYTSHIIEHNENSDQINENLSLSKQQQDASSQLKFQATQQQNTPQLALQTRQLQPQLDLSLQDRQDQILPIESSMNGNKNDMRQGKCQVEFQNQKDNVDFNSSTIRSSEKQEESIYPQQIINSSPKHKDNDKVTRAPITKQFMGQGFNLELQKYPLLLKSPHLHHKKMLSELTAYNPQSSMIGKLPQSIISESPMLFSPKSLQIQKLHSNHPLPNLMKCLKILCDINEFLIIRLFQNPSMKIDLDNVLDKIFGVWLCVNYEWKCITVDLNQILLSNPTLPYYLNHSKNQLWPYILQLALVKALNGYKTLLSTPCHKLFTLMTGSNSLFFNIKEDPTKNSRILRYISDCQNKNFVLHAQKVQKTLEELQKKDKQNRIYYVLSQKIVNDGQVLLQIKESTSQQSRWIRLNKFVQQFKSIQILQLRLNHNFTSLPIPRPSNTSNLTILQLEFLQQSFGSITLSTQSGASTLIMKTLLYRQQKSNILKLVGQAKQKNKSILFFDCYFGQNTKYYLFVQTKQDTRVTYLGQNQPLIRIVQEINSQGLKNDYTQYLPVKNIHSSNTTDRFQKENATFFKQKAPQKLTKSKFGQTGMSFKSQQDKISRLRQNFVQYLLKGKD